MSGHIAGWTGSKMVVWDGTAGQIYDPTTDSWGPINATGGTTGTGVWTGSKLIVWGGDVTNGVIKGAIYDSATDRWTGMSTTGAPTARRDHSSVWTGSRMIVWGGYDELGGTTKTGHAYDPSTDTWRASSTVGAPSARSRHIAVWTGSKMIVWGGWDDNQRFVRTGGLYDPSTDSWSPTSTVGAPDKSDGKALWTGSRMIVFGYDDSYPYRRTDAIYDPSSDAWAPMSRAGAPAVRTGSTALLIASKVIVWGGYAVLETPGALPVSAYVNTGAIYDPATDTWTAVNTLGAPPGRAGHTAVWTGSRMMVWGGQTVTGTSLNTGGSYDPAAGTWTLTAAPGYGDAAVWTGSQMIVWGLEPDGGCPRPGSGGVYDPVADTWVVTPTEGAPFARSGHAAVWSGMKMLVWGGTVRSGGFCSSSSSSLGYIIVNTGGVFDPAANAWATMTVDGAPPARTGHTAVWTGSKMIIWGGADLEHPTSRTSFRTGGLYDPATDTWARTSVTGAPAGRSGHTAVWTGSKMIVWGGATSGVASRRLDDGGIYDLATDSWRPITSTGELSAWLGHTAVWTGSKMIVWGGAGSRSPVGAVYDPESDTWTRMNTAGSPPGRGEHSAVWTGSRMIVWGGFAGGNLSSTTNTGGVYDPASDTWTAMSTTSAPAARNHHTAVWTGSRMIVRGPLIGNSVPLRPDLGIFDPQSTPSISLRDANVIEGDTGATTAVFEVTLSPAAQVAVTVSYATADGSAHSGIDFESSAGSLTFAPGQTHTTVAIGIIGDTRVEGNETFTIKLSEAVNSTLGRSLAAGTILDDDLKLESFVVRPTVADRPGNATLTWRFTEGAAVSVSGIDRTFPAAGSTTVPFTKTTTFTLTARAASVTTTAIATVTVLPTAGAALDFPTITAPASGREVAVSGVTFIWDPVAGASGYDVRVFDGLDGRTLFSGSLAGASAGSTLLTLPAGLHLFALRACGASFTDAGCGSFATRDVRVSPATPADKPRITSPANDASLASSTQTLSWTAVTKAASGQPLYYEVLLEDLAAGRTALRIAVPDATTTVATLPSSASYRMRVRACQSACGPYSDPVAFRMTLPPAPVAAPVITSATVGSDAQGANVLRATWSDVPGADLYRFQVVQQGAGPGGSALTVAARQISTTDVTVPIPAGTSSLLVQACTSDGCGSPSTPFVINASARDPSAPNVGTPLAGSVVAGPIVQFSWSRVPGDTGTNTVYRLYVQDLSRQGPALDVRTSANFYAAYFRAEGARYDAQVIANPATAQEAAGPPNGFIVSGASSAAPTMVQPAHGSSVKEGNIQLGWSPVPGTALYEYFVAIRGASDATVRGVTTGLVVQVPLLADAGRAAEYSGIVRACSAGNRTCAPGSDAGWGPWSNLAGPGVTNFTVTP